MNNFISVPALDRTKIINLDHLVRIEEQDVTAQFRCILHLSDGSKVEIQEDLEDFCARCNIPLHE